MKKTLCFISLFLTASQAAEPSSSGPLNITPKYHPYLRKSTSSDSISGESLTVFSTKQGTCTYSTYTSNSLGDILHKAKKLTDPEVLIHQSVFLKGIRTTLPDNTIGIVWDYLHHPIIAELSSLEVKTDGFQKLHNLGEIDSNTVTIVIITALSQEDNTELFNRFMDELQVSQLTDKNFILANIPQESISAPRSEQQPRRNKPTTSSRSYTPDDAIFPMDDF